MLLFYYSTKREQQLLGAHPSRASECSFVCVCVWGIFLSVVCCVFSFLDYLHAVAQTMSAPFAGQVAIVTGGAGGIGLATAQQLAKDGVNVALVDMQQSALDKAQSTLCAAVPGASCMTIAGDVADTAEADSAVHRVLSRWGRLDILVQAAGITGKTNLKTADVDPANFDQVLRVNLRGIFAFCRAALRVMSKAGYGRIVNIASIAGKEGNAGMLAYSASKAAVIGLTKTIGKEYAETGDITCNAVAPAVVRTAMVAAMPDAQVKYMTDKIPKKRTCELDEVVAVICFAASPSFCFVYD